MKNYALALLIGVWTLSTLTVAALACGEVTSQFETIQTFEAEQKVINATATAEAVIAEGGDPDAGIQVGANTIAAQIQATAQARATADAETGSQTGGRAVGTDAGSEQAQVTGSEDEETEIEIPEGPALEGEATVIMADPAFFEPEIIKVKVGTTVTWENPRSSASSATSFDGEAEQWDTTDLWKSSFNPEVGSASHTFQIVGCHRYRSEFSGDTATGAVCVVE